MPLRVCTNYFCDSPIGFVVGDQRLGTLDLSLQIYKELTVSFGTKEG